MMGNTARGLFQRMVELCFGAKMVWDSRGISKVTRVIFNVVVFFEGETLLLAGLRIYHPTDHKATRE